MADHKIDIFNSGVHNLLPDEKIPKDAAQDSVNWTTKSGVIELGYGRTLVGDRGGAGRTRNLGVGFKTNGQKVIYRKKGTVIQYLNGTTWTDVITGLDVTHDYIFPNYSSLAGAFTFALGIGGIYKFHNANPGSYIDLYDSSKNFKGKGIIDKGRMLMWGITNDPTGLRGSFIDAQNSVVYTTVTNEVVGTGNGVQTVFTGTLAFKGANPKANCFGLSLNMNPSGITAVDDFNGIISGTGVTGTINYVTGAFSLTFSAPVANTTQIRITYQWENSNAKGVTDFTYSPTRLAGEGFIIRQDEGGDAIQNVLLGLDDSYYSIKQYSVYRLTLDTTDTKPDNQVYRKDLGIPYWQCAVATGRGILFMNTANPKKPELTVLEKNPIGDNIVPTVLLEHFDFSKYDFSEAVMEAWEQYIVVACKAEGSLANDRILLCNITDNSVDIYKYNAACLKKDGGTLYGGDASTENVFKFFDGFDDDESVIENFWDSKGELMGIENLKKHRKLRLQGLIETGQVLEVYVSYDNGDYTLAGTIRGDASTIDAGASGTIGSSMVGSSLIGGSGELVEANAYFFELKMRSPKFRKRSIRLVATKFGYVSCSFLMDWDILVFEQRIPKRYRLKQNVSKDGKLTDQPA